MMKGPKCQFENPEKAKYCIKCGKPMEFHYPEGGAKTPVIGDFCYVCVSLAAGTRRVLVSQRDLGREWPSYR
jgi:hypothetical protein